MQKEDPRVERKRERKWKEIRRRIIFFTN